MTEISSNEYSLTSDAILAMDAVVLSFLARDFMVISIFFLSLAFPSSLAASSMIISRYPDIMDAARFASMFTLPGHPPRRVSSTRRSKSIFFVGVLQNVESNIDLRLTEPSEFPDSKRDIVRIRTFPMRPAPLCIPFLTGVEDPVRMNCPRLPRASTSLLTASQIVGTSCHSSMRCGVVPVNAYVSSKPASVLF